MRTLAFILASAGIAAADVEQAPQPREAPAAEKGKELWAAVSVSDTVLNWDTLDWDLGTRGPFMIHFYLVNDGDKVIDPKVRSTQLFINGKECKGPNAPYGVDWPFIIANGLRDKRWRALPPGDYIGFGYAMGDYFKEPGRYRIKWKGEGYESPEIEFRVMPRKKNGK